MFTENSNKTPAHLYRGRRYGKPFLRVFFEELPRTKFLPREYENPILPIFVAAYQIKHIICYVSHKIFLQNCVNYLLDDNNFLQLRNKKVALAFLDKKKISEEQKKWQLISFFFPLLVLLILGVIVHFFYKKQH